MAVLAACASAPQALSVQQPRRQAGPQQQWRPAVAAPRRPAAARRPVQSSASGAGQQAAASVPFPEDYAQAVRQAGDAVKAALVRLGYSELLLLLLSKLSCSYRLCAGN